MYYWHGGRYSIFRERPDRFDRGGASPGAPSVRAFGGSQLDERPAGAGVLDHVHLHVVPRWNGDTNHMTVLTRVLPEELTQTAEKLRPIFARLSS